MYRNNRASFTLLKPKERRNLDKARESFFATNVYKKGEMTEGGKCEKVVYSVAERLRDLRDIFSLYEVARLSVNTRIS